MGTGRRNTEHRRMRADDHARSTDLAPSEERINADPGRIVYPDGAGETCRLLAPRRKAALSDNSGRERYCSVSLGDHAGASSSARHGLNGSSQPLAECGELGNAARGHFIEGRHVP
jgi:hypothetical protein